MGSMFIDLIIYYVCTYKYKQTTYCRCAGPCDMSGRMLCAISLSSEWTLSSKQASGCVRLERLFPINQQLFHNVIRIRIRYTSFIIAHYKLIKIITDLVYRSTKRSNTLSHVLNRTIVIYIYLSSGVTALTSRGCATGSVAVAVRSK